MDYKAIENSVIKIAQETGQFIKNERLAFNQSDIETKGKNDFVSYVDKKAEKQIVEKLSILLPEAGYITEEGTNNTQSETYNWIIDPLDGTTNFIHGLEPYAVSIALQANNELVVGVVHEIGKNETFHASKNGGAYLNGSPIQVSDCKRVEDGLFATGFPYYNYKKLDRFMLTLEYFMQYSHGLRRLGSAATDFAYVAAGRADGFYEYGLHAWDLAAGALIVREAGGKVTDFSGKDNWMFPGEIIAGNANVFDEFFSIISKIMQD